MNKTSTYFVIAPIDGIRIDFDHHMYGSELFSCQSNSKPDSDSCPLFREPYQLLSRIPFNGYPKLIPGMISDPATINVLSSLPDRKMNEYTCIGFEIDNESSAGLIKAETILDESLIKNVFERGDTLLDPLRLSIFQPGKNESAGKFGSVGNGIQCFWIGNEENVKFFARKSQRFDLVQEPIDVLESKFGPIYASFVFRVLCFSVSQNPHDRSVVQSAILRALRAFRESRDITSPEARFRQLAAIAEDLAKFKEGERISGRELRERIAKISSNGWALYQGYNESVSGTKLLNAENIRILNKRYKEIGWTDKDEAIQNVRDLWENVRNPFSHSLDTFETLERDAIQDIANAERIVVTMIHGWCAAYEVEEFYEKPFKEILLGEEQSPDEPPLS